MRDRLIQILALCWPAHRLAGPESALVSIWTAILQTTTREFERLRTEAATARRLPEESSEARLCRRNIVQLAGLLGGLPAAVVGALLQASTATRDRLPTLLLLGKSTTLLRIVHGLEPELPAGVYLSAAPFIAAEDLLFHAGRDRLLVRRVLESTTRRDPSRSERILALMGWFDHLERGGTIVPRYGHPRSPVDNPYALLGVTVNAGDNEIVTNHRLLSRELHEDRNPENPVRAALLFGRVTEAYQTLRNPRKRAAFNSVRPADAHYYPVRNVFSSVLAHARMNVAWRNGPVEDIHAGSFQGYPLTQQRVTSAKEKELR